MNGKKSVYFKGLGCPKNEVDGDVILGHLQQRGLNVVSDPHEADYLIVNTCAFIQSAKEESIEEIMKLAAVKNINGRQQRLLVSGCLAQRYPNELLEQIGEIDGMVGIDEYEKIGSILDSDSAYITRPPSLYKEAHAVQILRDRPFAYLKIADGCDNRCTYCAIPSIRGDFRSRSLEAIDRDVERLLSNGVIELNLIAQDVSVYGFDIGKHPLDLLKMIEDRAGDFWVRPFYLHPRHLSDEIIEFLASSSKFCGYLESPIQHINSRILKKMNRGYDREAIERLLERVKVKLPGSVLRTTFIVGFPGESSKEFEELCLFVEEAGISRAGVFGYSREDSTPAYKYRGNLNQPEIRKRQEELERLINENAEVYNASLVGREMKMVVESFDSEIKIATGRLFCDAPEIDFTIRARSDRHAERGFGKVKVTGVTQEGFFGELAA